MRALVAIAIIVLASACSSPHAARVRCDGRLVPINTHRQVAPEHLASRVAGDLRRSPL